MACLTNFRGLQIANPDPPTSADAGLALNNNFKALTTNQVSGPPAGASGPVGARWLDTTASKEYICTAESGGVGTWLDLSAYLQIVGGTLTGNLTVNANATITGTTTTATLKTDNLQGSTGGTITVASNLSASGHTITADSFIGSGTSLSNLTASNLTIGQAPVAALGAGTPSSSTFLCGNGNWTSISTANVTGLGSIATHSTADFLAITGGTLTGPTIVQASAACTTLFKIAPTNGSGSGGSYGFNGTLFDISDAMYDYFNLSYGAGYTIINCNNFNSGFWFQKNINLSNNCVVGNANTGGGIKFTGGHTVIVDSSNNPIADFSTGNISLSNNSLIFNATGGGGIKFSGGHTYIVNSSNATTADFYSSTITFAANTTLNGSLNVNGSLTSNGTTTSNGPIYCQGANYLYTDVIQSSDLKLGDLDTGLYIEIFTASELVQFFGLDLNIQGNSIFDCLQLSIADGGSITGGDSSGMSINLEPDAKLGFWGATPIIQPTVTGSKGGNAALASLISALAAMGLIVDGTS